MAKKERKNEFEISGGIVPTETTGFEFRDSFSPSESLDGMQERMAERVKKVRKIKKNNIFVNPFRSTDE